MRIALFAEHACPAATLCMCTPSELQTNQSEVIVHEEDLLAENRRFGPDRLHAHCPVEVRSPVTCRGEATWPLISVPRFATSKRSLPASLLAHSGEKCPQSVVAANRRSTTWPRAPADLLFDKLAKSAVHVGAAPQRAGKQRSTRRCSMVSPPRRQGTRTRLCHRLCGTRAGNARVRSWPCGAG